ncbi:FAD-binding oxidoreductase [Amorphoplanes nipponensis]|uniref:Glycolate oxidase n=1 Tax=Actinoplanes nipponensis TaxID=135950 RepID=A0A919MJQ4_9ACTN|nr:FAD-binding oxidoreductase [Actinoplanes nipponensis]GIE52054.1 glycolate oxidase [Actinoplanes nipponensis]
MVTALPGREPLLRALIDICGPDFAREAVAADMVAGHLASFVAAPATTRAVMDTLRLAAERGLAVLPRGAGSKIDWGSPPPGIDLLLDTARLDGIWDHDPQQRTAQIGTGTPVRAVQAALALRGQRLAVDPPSPAATIGGMLAVNESGPLRHRYGSPAAQVERISYVGVDGVPAESNGENGNPGIAEVTGVIVSAGFRLQPLPAARRWVLAPATTPLQVRDLVEATLAQRVTPSAIEVDLPAPSGPAAGGALAVLLEGDTADAIGQAAQVATALGDEATVTPTAPRWWGRYPFDRDDVALRIAVPIADLHAAVYALQDAAGMAVPVRGSAGLGTVHAVLPGTLPPARVEGILDAVRGVLLARGGRCVVIAAPPPISTTVDMAGRRDLF